MINAVDQFGLFPPQVIEKTGLFPTTRYQGSKSKILDWIHYCTKDLVFDSVLDAFGGTGSVGYMYKQGGKRVVYNDSLHFNYKIGLALIENDSVTLDNDDLILILNQDSKIRYPSFIQDTFKDIYFTDEENRWLDIVSTNIRRMEDKHKQALAYYALFQACIIKRPYNLFHRKNLYIRMAEVERSFGNKKTWDTSFEQHFLNFVEQGNNAVFANGKNNRAINADVFDLDIPRVDLVYIDTPYISGKGVGVDYLDFYHFLEGLVFYDQWDDLIDRDSKHKKIKNVKSEWSNKTSIHSAFQRLFQKFKDSLLVVSYREDGTPTIPEILNMLSEYKRSIEIKTMNYQYVLSNEHSREVLIIAQ